MSAKFKLFLVFALSAFATTVVAGVYRLKQWHSGKIRAVANQQQYQGYEISNQEILAESYKRKYKSIPLTRFRTVLRGTDPAALAVNALDATQSDVGNRQVEVVYPQPNQAMVTITQTNLASSQPKPVKYRVKLTSLGRSFFVTSPPLWQIVWAGSYEQCLTSTTATISSATCQ
ncbi:MAG: hypothetical protein SWZ49_10530 [Cyanobacteriota bacterium]|nr:hypothetical protein [Cyanobacteriota bacterium]